MIPEASGGGGAAGGDPASGGPASGEAGGGPAGGEAGGGRGGSGGGAPAQPAPVPPAVDAWLGRVTALLAEAGRQEAVAVLRQERARQPRAKPVVVVAGEDKRGKSSLINALLRRPSLSPVGVEVTTGSPITFFKSRQEVAYYFRFDDAERHETDLLQAQRLATVQGNPGNAESVRAVTIGVDAPLLDQLTIVDTPGVGGLESGHAALTLQRLRDADALLFVLEAAAQVRAEELRFLEKASGRIHRVVFALTKTDRYRGWQQILEDNRRILAERAPRLAACPIVPVSALLAQRAGSLPAAVAEQVRAESGFAELESVLVDQVAANAGELKVANLVQAALTPLAGLEHDLAARIEALGSPEEAERALAAERARLAQLSTERAEWPQTLQVGLRRLGLDRGEEVSRGMLEIRSAYEERLKKVKIEEHDTLPGELIADLTALAARVNEWTEEQLQRIVADLVADLEQQAQILHALHGVGDGGLAEEMASIQLGDISLNANEKLGVAQAYMSGHSVASTIAVGALAAFGLSFLALPLGLLAGGAMMYTRFRLSKQGNFAQEFSSWMGEQVQRTQLAVSNAYQRSQIDFEVSIRDALKASFAERERQINESIARCQEAGRQEQGERQRARQQAQPRLDLARALAGEGLSLLGGIAKGTAAGGTGRR